jgi:hypothetical protein
MCIEYVREGERERERGRERNRERRNILVLQSYFSD